MTIEKTTTPSTATGIGVPGMNWTESFAAAVRSMEIALGGARYGERPSLRAVNGARLMLPYVLHPMRGLPAYWIWLNRSYKPIGTLSAHAIYEDYKHLHVRRDDKRIALLIKRGKPFRPSMGPEIGVALYDGLTDPTRSLKLARAYADLLALVSYDD